MHSLTLVLVSVLLAAPPPAEVKRVAAEVLSREEVQTRLPLGPREEQPPQRHGDDDLDLSPSPDPWGSGLAEVVLWVAAIIALVVGGVYLAQRLGGYSAELAGPASEAEAAASANPRAPPPLDDADRLAAAGRYEEAIHTLLLLALRPLTERRHLAGSLTSREVLRTEQLPAPAHEALTALVGAVELAIFGGRTPGAPEYERCAASYRTYAASMQPEAA